MINDFKGEKDTIKLTGLKRLPTGEKKKSREKANSKFSINSHLRPQVIIDNLFLRGFFGDNISLFLIF